MKKQVSSPFTVVVVELAGLEPATLCLQSRCATSCAIAPLEQETPLQVLPYSRIIAKVICRIHQPGEKHPDKQQFEGLFQIYLPGRLLEQTSLAVGLAGLEPATSVLSGLRSNQLSYRPIVSIANTIADYNIPNPAFKPVLGAFRHAALEILQPAKNTVLLLVGQRQPDPTNQ